MMRPQYSTTAPAVFEPLTLAQSAEHVRVDSEDDHAYLQALTLVAREYVDSVTGRVSAETGFLVVADSWASLLGYCQTDRIPLFRTPLQSVQSVSYYAPDDASLTVMDTADYRTITTTEPGMIQITADLPDVDDRPDAIQIRFKAGYADPSTAPAILQHAVKMLVAHFYEQRVPIAFAMASQIPFGLANLMENQKVGGWSA